MRLNQKQQTKWKQENPVMKWFMNSVSKNDLRLEMIELILMRRVTDLVKSGVAPVLCWLTAVTCDLYPVPSSPALLSLSVGLSAVLSAFQRLPPRSCI